MNIGLSIYSLIRDLESGKMSPIDAFSWVKENGGDHLELVSFAVDFLARPELIPAFCERSRETGVPVSAYCHSGDLIKKDREAYLGELSHIKRQIDIAHRLGAKIMRCDYAPHRLPPAEIQPEAFDRWFPQLVDGCGQLADYAEELGMILTVENHGYFNNGGERIRRLLTGVNRRNFRCTLDVGNSLCVDEPPENCVQALLPYAAVIHFKDFYVRTDPALCGEGAWFPTTHGKILRGAIVGHGEIDLRKIMQLIRAHGYDGYLTVEFEGMEDCRQGSRIGMANLRRLAEETEGGCVHAS